MKKNNKILYAVLATTCPIIIGLTSFSLFLINKKSKLNNVETNSKPEKTKEKNENNNEEGYKYVVKEMEGKIAVFENGKNSPIETLEKEVEYLPEYDKKILKDGIYVENPQELNKVLEDYED